MVSAHPENCPLLRTQREEGRAQSRLGGTASDFESLGCAPVTNRDRRRDERITMAAKIIDGKALAARIRGELAVEAQNSTSGAFSPRWR